MKIQKLINKVQNNIARRNILKNEKRINSYVRIHDIPEFGDSFEQIYSARETIANYAKRNGIKVDILQTEKENVKNTNNKDNLIVIVTNLLTGKSQLKTVSDNTDILYPKISERKILVPVAHDELEIGRTGSKRTEDTFLRNLYRCIEDLTKKVTDKTVK